MVDPPNAADANVRDTLARYAILTPSEFDQDYNPSIYVKWYLSNGQVIRDDKPLVHMISYADYLRTAVDAVAVVDYDEMDSVLSASHGPGLWGSSGGTGANVVRINVDDTANGVPVTNVTVVVFSAVDAVTIEGWGITNQSGYFDFSLNDGTYLARVNTPPGYIQPTANDTIVVSGPTSAIVETYAFYPVLPSSSDSTTLVFYLPNREWTVRVTPLLREEGTTDTAGVLVLPYPIYGNPDVNDIAQVKVLRSKACDPEMPYEILVYRKSDKQQLLKLNDYITPDSMSTTVSW